MATKETKKVYLGQMDATNEQLTRYSGKPKQIIIAKEDNYRPIIMDGTTVGGKFKCASTDELDTAKQDLQSQIDSILEGTGEDGDASLISKLDKVVYESEKPFFARRNEGNTFEADNTFNTNITVKGTATLAGTTTDSLTVNYGATFAQNPSSYPLPTEGNHLCNKSYVDREIGDVASDLTTLSNAVVKKTVQDGSNWMDSRSSTKKGTFNVGLDSSTLKQETISDGIATFKSEIEVKTTGEIFLKGSKVYVTTNQEGADKKEVATKEDVENAAGLPLGHMFWWYGKTAPEGAIICNGGILYNKALYQDLFNFLKEAGVVISESEWQSQASSQNSYCAFFSDNGDTFRVPNFAPYPRITKDPTMCGKYWEPALPNITGTFLPWAWKNSASEATGCFNDSSGTNKSSYNAPDYASGYMVDFKASNSNKIYGKSNTVQPESMNFVLCIQAINKATNIGEADVSEVMGAIAQVQASISALRSSINEKPALNTEVYITETWHNGTQGYRKWSDGWLEQWGYMTGYSTTYAKAYRDTNYVILSNVLRGITVANSGDWITGKTTTGCSRGYTTAPLNWFACGYGS